jgi:hypothetical protein
MDNHFFAASFLAGRRSLAAGRPWKKNCQGIFSTNL